MSLDFKQRREFTVYGYISSYIQQKYTLSYLIPNSVKNVCLDFYGHFYEESFVALDSSGIKITDKQDNTVKISLEPVYTVYNWVRTWGKTEIDLTKDGIYKWKFHINKLSMSRLRVGIGDGDRKWLCFQTWNGQGDLHCETWHYGRIKGYCTERFNNGDTLTLEFGLINKVQCYVKIYRNDKDFGQAFENKVERYGDKKGKVFVDLLSRNDNITLISFGIK